MTGPPPYGIDNILAILCRREPNNTIAIQKEELLALTRGTLVWDTNELTGGLVLKYFNDREPQR